MKTDQALQKMTDVIRRKHLALSYCAWLRRYCDHLLKVPGHLTSEQKLERFLTALATEGLAASTQNQARNAIIFFYRRSSVACRMRRKPRSRQGQPKIARRFNAGARGDHTRVPRGRLRGVLAFSSAVPAGRGLPRFPPGVETPGYSPASLRDSSGRQATGLRLGCDWAWLFPAAQPCLNPRTGTPVRWRLHGANIQRAIRQACRKAGLFILPHELRHAYATHCLNRGANPRAIQEVMGHKSLETTMAYLHAEALGVRSPLDG